VVQILIAMNVPEFNGSISPTRRGDAIMTEAIKTEAFQPDYAWRKSPPNVQPNASIAF